MGRIRALCRPQDGSKQFVKSEFEPSGYTLSPMVNTVPATLSSSAAVASSPVEEQDAMSPAPTSTTLVATPVPIVALVVAGALVAPLASVTTSVTVYVPSVAYVCVGATPASVAPSPKAQA